MPIKHSFTPQELINTYNRKVMNKVAEIFASSPQREGVILEDCGSWLVQEAWQDRVGFYMTIRLAPLDLRREDVQEEGRIITRKFLDMFPDRTANGTFYEGQDGYLEGEKVTVFVQTASFSIAD
ncbi:MAG: hypothetical protein EBZ91_08880 [Gammaproteobacteria bacterium]|nr:hypothetical protein [Gammaproteobacteria bacterium]